MQTFTPAMMAHAYEFMRASPPMKRLGLPPADQVVFRVKRDPTLRGWYHFEGGKHYISISARVIGHTLFLMMTMAHEMLHLHQRAQGLETPGAVHNAGFKKLAARVCRYHGFDPLMF